MRRRGAIALLGGAAAWPLVVPGRGAAAAPALVGVLAPRAAPGPQEAAFFQGLRELGHVEGNDVAIAFRGVAGDPHRLDALAGELVALNPRVIFAAGSEPTRAAIAATDRIPIVFGSSNPLAVGAVDNLARPRANVTGVSFQNAEASAKRLDLVREILPAARRVSVVWNPQDPAADSARHETEAGAVRLGITVAILRASAAPDLEAAFAAAARDRADAVVLLPAPLITDNADLLARLALTNRLPAIGHSANFPAAGGLMAFGSDTGAAFRAAAGYVSRILKGAKPADLPVQQPTGFALTINLNTARALGLSLPPLLLARADRVIE